MKLITKKASLSVSCWETVRLDKERFLELAKFRRTTFGIGSGFPRPSGTSSQEIPEGAQ